MTISRMTEAYVVIGITLARLFVGDVTAAFARRALVLAHVMACRLMPPFFPGGFPAADVDHRSQDHQT